MEHTANLNKVEFSPIGIVHSPYKEKFAIPRQPGLVSEVKGSIELTGVHNNANLVRGLEGCSHIWVLFLFHGTMDNGWKSLVRPPRLGGNKKVGVLATRSTFRPNPIGMSVVKLDSVQWIDNRLKLEISGLDLLDQTPVIDIKPYVPYSDSLPEATCEIAPQAPESNLTISFEDPVEEKITALASTYPKLRVMVEQVLKQDPRPAYKHHKHDDGEYGMRLYDLNIRWRLIGLNEISVFSIEEV